MIENLNDILSLTVLIFIAFASLRYLVAALRSNKDEKIKKKQSIIYDYPDNEDDQENKLFPYINLYAGLFNYC